MQRDNYKRNPKVTQAIFLNIKYSKNDRFLTVNTLAEIKRIGFLIVFFTYEKMRIPNNKNNKLKKMKENNFDLF